MTFFLLTICSLYHVSRFLDFIKFCKNYIQSVQKKEKIFKQKTITIYSQLH